MIKRRGTVLIRDVVDDAQAVGWKDQLKKFVKVNDDRGVEGIHCLQGYKHPLISQTRYSRQRQAVFPPLVRSIFFFRCSIFLTQLTSWTKPQVQARSHPNLLAATVWLNNLYHVQVDSEKNSQLAKTMKGVDLNTPLTYADRFRIRKPGIQWDFHPPHVDGVYRISRTIHVFFSFGILVRRKY
jgi:hypothetical protein